MSRKLMAAVSTAVLLWAVPALADGELHIYNWGDYTNPKLIEKFEKQYNIKVTLDDYDSNETMPGPVGALRPWCSNHSVQAPGRVAICRSGRRPILAGVAMARPARNAGDTTGATVSRTKSVESASGQSGGP